MHLSRSQNSEIFALTLGGLGLTGLVTRAVLRLQRLKGFSLFREKFVVRSLDEAVEMMESQKHRFSQVYSWNDLNARGNKFGRGYIYGESFSTEKKPGDLKIGDLQSQMPKWPKFVAAAAVRSINPVYRAMENFRSATQTFDLLNGAFPLNGREVYFKAVANKSFHETQIIIPFKNWNRFSQRLAHLFSRHAVHASLGSLKLFKGASSLLNFQMDGVCLAVDLPKQSNDLLFMSALDELMLENGGIPNLSKDSRLNARVVAAAYPEYHKFKEQLHAFDPKYRMQSALRRRIDV